MLESAILLPDSIRFGLSYRIERRCANGVIIGAMYDADARESDHVAITVDILKGSTVLHPVVGIFSDTSGQIWPDNKSYPQGLKYWRRELRVRPRLEWLRRLKAHIQPQRWTKVTLEDYSIADVTTLGQRGWFIGRSAHAPLWRIYAIIPEELYEHGELPLLDGTMRSMDRFGAIYDPYKHKIVLK